MLTSLLETMYMRHIVVWFTVQIYFVTAWNTNIRRLLGIHAFTSSASKEIRDEVFQQQLGNLVSSDSILFNFSETIDSWTRDNHLLYSVVGFCTVIGIVELYNKTSLNKLLDIPEYVSLRRSFRIGFVIFLCIFFRSVDNAI